MSGSIPTRASIFFSHISEMFKRVKAVYFQRCFYQEELLKNHLKVPVCRFLGILITKVVIRSLYEQQFVR